VLKQFLEEDRAKTLAAAWDGDRYAVFEQKQTKKLVLVTRLHLDSEEHAVRFFGQYSKRWRMKYASARICSAAQTFFHSILRMEAVPGCLGNECVTMEGAARKTFDAFTKELSWL